MATNLKIAHPDAILRAKCYLSDHNRNMINGPRDLWQAVVAGTVTDSYYALPYNETIQPEFLYIARIDATVRASSNDVTVELLGAPDDSANDESESAAIGITDLMGPASEDYLLATTFASAYRFWQVQITTSDSLVHTASSIYFGNFFDMGRDPVYRSQYRTVLSSSSHRRPVREFELYYEGITYAKQQSFVDTIYKGAKYNPIVLWDSNEYWFENKLLHCMITDARFDLQDEEHFKIRLSLRELI